jgi:hypothetical protein
MYFITNLPHFSRLILINALNCRKPASARRLSVDCLQTFSLGELCQRPVLLFCRDRDELASQVSILKVRLEEMKHREQDAYLQVKSSIEMVEQSQLDMAQVGGL